MTIDDVSIGRSPLREPVLASAGRRKIAATKAGLTPASRVIDLAGGDKPRVSLELVEQQTAPPQIVVQQTGGGDGATVTEHPQTPPDTVRMTSGPSTAFYVALGVTGAAAVATGIFGGLALSAKGTYDSRIAQLGVTSSQVDSARSDVKTFALVTDICGGVAIAGVITTVVLALTTSSKHPVKDTPRASFFVSPTAIGISGVW